MLAVIASLVITWLSLGLIMYVVSDMTYKECISNSGIAYLMLLIGWIPAVIVGADLEKKFRYE